MVKDFWDFLWDLKKDVEKTAKTHGGSCDLIWGPRDIWRYGFKCKTDRVGIELPSGYDKSEGKHCRIFILNLTREERDKLMSETDLFIGVAPYDVGKFRAHEKFDGEIEVPCDRQIIEKVFEKILKVT